MYNMQCSLFLQVTALGNPMLLERMSAALLEIRSLFREADRDGEARGTQLLLQAHLSSSFSSRAARASGHVGSR
jgi:hypothetical protein